MKKYFVKIEITTNCKMNDDLEIDFIDKVENFMSIHESGFYNNDLSFEEKKEFKKGIE